MSSSTYLANRTTSAANVSVGTSIALETILPGWPVFDPARVAPSKVKLTAYRYVYFNLWTLGRNLHESVEMEGRDKLNYADAGAALIEEAEEIIRAITAASAGAVKAIIYYPSYKSLGREYPKGKLREPVTDKAIASTKFLTDMCDYAAKGLESSHKGNFKRFNVQLATDGIGNTLIFTHFPVDLLSDRSFGKLDLLESHTGVVKQKNQWHTKLFNGKNFANIPFNALTIQVFGDNHQFRPWEMKIKNALSVMAVRYRWSWATTAVRMRMDVAAHPDRIFAMALENLL